MEDKSKKKRSATEKKKGGAQAPEQKKGAPIPERRKVGAQALEQKKDAQAAEEKATPKMAEEILGKLREKWLPHRVNLVAVVLVVLSCLVGGLMLIKWTQIEAEESWQVLSEIAQSNRSEQALPSNFFQKKFELLKEVPPAMLFRDESVGPRSSVRDLCEEGILFLLKNIGDTNGLPDIFTDPKERAEWEKLPPAMRPDRPKRSLGYYPLRFLPARLVRSALLFDHIDKLQVQALEAERTSAGPWLCYTLANLYAWHNAEKALQYYNFVAYRYPDFVLNRGPVVEKKTLQDRAPLALAKTAASNDRIWEVQNPRPPEFDLASAGEKGTIKIVMVTTKGRIELNLFAREFPVAAANFIYLTQNGFYNGLNFYRADDERVFAGCPLGNGKGGPGYVREAEKRDVTAQRGLVLMENIGRPGSVGSRFFIAKKVLSLSEHHVILGMLTSGMDVADSLTPQDVLLDVAIGETRFRDMTPQSAKSNLLDLLPK